MHKVKGSNHVPEAGRAPFTENCAFSPRFVAGLGRNVLWCTWQFPRGGVPHGVQ